MSYMPPPTSGPQEFVPNRLVWAILSTLFCCLPLGIVSIVYAAQVDGKRAAGDIAGAREASGKAGMWALFSVFAGPVVMLIWLMLFGGMAILGGLTGMG